MTSVFSENKFHAVTVANFKQFLLLFTKSFKLHLIVLGSTFSYQFELPSPIVKVTPLSEKLTWTA